MYKLNLKILISIVENFDIDLPEITNICLLFFLASDSQSLILEVSGDITIARVYESENSIIPKSLLRRS